MKVGLRWSVVIAAWITALFPLRIAGGLLVLYVTHGQGWPAGIHMALPQIGWSAAYVAAGLLYLRVPGLRPLILLAAVFMAISGLVQLPAYVHHLETLNLWHNILAEGVWKTSGRCAVSVLAMAHVIAERVNRVRT